MSWISYQLTFLLSWIACQLNFFISWIAYHLDFWSSCVISWILYRMIVLSAEFLVSLIAYQLNFLSAAWCVNGNLSLPERDSWLTEFLGMWIVLWLNVLIAEVPTYLISWSSELRVRWIVRYSWASQLVSFSLAEVLLAELCLSNRIALVEFLISWISA